jgi:hypothetical protein
MAAWGSLLVAQIVRDGNIKDVDVLRLRASLHDLLSAEEAELLFRLNEACPQHHPAWAEFYVKTLTDYLVEQSEPEGYLTSADAQRLIDRITRGGRTPSRLELDLVVNVLARSRWSPVSLCSFALEQVRRAVSDGDGPLRSGTDCATGFIRDSEVDLVRRILYAFGGDGCVAVTRAEAEVLFGINDAIADPADNPAWADLFVKAVTNVVMSASGRAVPTREEALCRDTAVIDRGELARDAVLSAMVRSSLEAIWGTYPEQSPEGRALARLEHQRIEIITGEQVTEAEASWLCERIGRGGRLTGNEAALVAYLKLEGPAMHPALQAAVDRLAEAA